MKAHALVSVAVLLGVLSSSSAFTLPGVLRPLATSSLQSRSVNTCKTSVKAPQRFLSSVGMTLKTEGMQRPAEVNIGAPLPIVYVYDHCPFCVRARFIFGLKNIKHEVRFMANDDVYTPTKLVGKKVVPILEIPSKGEVMNESLDIVKRIDEDTSFGPAILKPSTGRKDFNAWEKKNKDLFRQLQRPRYVMSPMLPEFAMKGGRDAFIFNHPVPPYEKPEWKNDLDYAKRIELYNEAFSRSATLLQEANNAVMELDPLIVSAKHCSEGGISYDDVELFGRLRSLTIIKGLELPAKVAGYLEYMSARTDIPLYTSLAI